MNIEIINCRDVEKVWAIICDRSVFNRVCDDNWIRKPLDELRLIVRTIVENPANHIPLFTVDGMIGGCFCCLAADAGVLEIHNFVLEKFRGSAAIKAARLAVKYLFSLTGVLVLKGSCPMHMPNTLLFAKLVGFKVVGLSPAKWLKNGEQHPMMMVELTKEALCP